MRDRPAAERRIFVVNDRSAKTSRYTQVCDSLPIMNFEPKEGLMLVMAAHALPT